MCRAGIDVDDDVRAQSGEDFGEQPFRKYNDAGDYHSGELASTSQAARPADTVSALGGHDGPRWSSGDLLRGVPKNRAVTWTNGLSGVGVTRDYFGRPHGLRGSLHSVHSGGAVVEHYRHGNVGRNFKNGNG